MEINYRIPWKMSQFMDAQVPYIQNERKDNPILIEFVSINRKQIITEFYRKKRGMHE